MLDTTVRAVMSREPTVLAPDAPVMSAMKTMLDQGISGAPVVDLHGNLVGLLTQRDCLTVAYRASYHGQVAGPVEAFMTRDPETVDADLPLVELIERFYRSPHRRFPVVEGPRLIGIVSRRDVLQAVVDLA